MTPDAREDEYPGRSMGLPRSGRGSIAPLSRRVAAFAIDWAAVVLLSIAFFDYAWWSTLVLFVIIQSVFVATASGSPGHHMCGLRVTRSDGAWVGPWRPIVRSVLIVLVIPAAIWDGDHRGMHDLFSGTVIVRAR
ncbi:RDD family protein [Microbacterium karelineae]|uniref:RDD family protein n=1 Tax=Microbacterium karelineae TaxID=2654283 RepID=UPI001E555D30|nr:RDD family protein [Microbacterium karelineae]